MMMAPPVVPPQPRRVFRGRGGPKDGRLPPKKTKKSPAVRHVAGTKYPPLSSCRPSSTRQNCHNQAQPDDDDDDYHHHEPDEAAIEEETTSMLQVSGTNDVDDTTATTSKNIQTVVKQLEESPCSMELRHLRLRIGNIQSSMTLSNTFSTSHYSSNVLNAILNAVYEWNAIYRRYYYYQPNSSSLVLLGEKEIQETAYLIFGLIQHGLQSGPLTGAKPGYFKRCGSEIALMVHSFLSKVENPPGITEQQQLTLAKWKANAEKALLVPGGKLPSKSVQKKIKESTCNTKRLK